MVSGDTISGLFAGLIILGLLIGGVVVGLSWWGIDYFTDNDDTYRVKQRIEPKIEVITIDGKSDTTYIYKF